MAYNHSPDEAEDDQGPEEHQYPSDFPMCSQCTFLSWLWVDGNGRLACIVDAEHAAVVPSCDVTGVHCRVSGVERTGTPRGDAGGTQGPGTHCGDPKDAEPKEEYRYAT